MLGFSPQLSPSCDLILFYGRSSWHKLRGMDMDGGESEVV
jgi:hypothetical protein